MKETIRAMLFWGIPTTCGFVLVSYLDFSPLPSIIAFLGSILAFLCGVFAGFFSFLFISAVGDLANWIISDPIHDKCDEEVSQKEYKKQENPIDK